MSSNERAMIIRCFAANLLVALPALAIGQVVPANDYAPRTVLAKPIPAITNPKIVEASEAQVAANDLIIGVEIGGKARAYPINQLTGPSREIINDVLAGTAIAATW